MSWTQLLSMLTEFREIRAAERAADPVACPNDGEPLQRAANGDLYCPFDGWRPD